MYDFITIPSTLLLSALLWSGGRSAAAEPSVTASVRTLSTSTLTTVNGRISTSWGEQPNSMPSDIVDVQGSLLTIPPSVGLQRSVCASWVDPQSHSTIYEQCPGGEACMLIVLLEDSANSIYYDISSLIGCIAGTLPPITTMYPYQDPQPTGCWESGFGCCSKNEPYNILLATADHHAAMFACAMGNYGTLPVLGFEWEMGTMLARDTSLFAPETSSTTIGATSTRASSTPGSAIILASPTPTALPNLTQPPQGTSSRVLSGKSKAGIAVGSIIGGWTLLAFAAVLLWRYRKRRRQQQQPEFSFGGLERADDDGKGDIPDRTAQAAPPRLPEHLVSGLDTKTTVNPASTAPGVEATELAGSSPEKTELAGSSPTSAELTGSPIVTPMEPGSESPVLPPDPLRSLSVSSSETAVSPNPPPLRLLSAVDSIPEEEGRSEISS